MGCFTCVTGVSGSGKSSLVNGILYPYLARELNGALTYPGSFGSIEGTEQLDKVICIDQSPIGRTPRSNPATYTGLFTAIRELFSQTPDAKRRAYGPGRFSFNVKGGRCEACEGDGVKTIEMHFLPDVYVQCDVCKGKRYNKETLEVHYKDKSIADVLDMTVSEGVVFFENIPKIHRILKTMEVVGLGYIGIGQAATTLSEAKPRESSWPPSFPSAAPAKPSTFWTNPPPDCTPPMCRTFCIFWNGLLKTETPFWSSSTIWM